MSPFPKNKLVIIRRKESANPRLLWLRQSSVGEHQRELAGKGDRVRRLLITVAGLVIFFFFLSMVLDTLGIVRKRG